MATINYEMVSALEEQADSKPLRFFRWLKKVSEGAFHNLSLVMAPLLPAFLFGLSVGYYIAHLYGKELGIIIGFAAGFSIESAGYNAFRAAQKEKRPWKAAAYLLIGIVGTIVLEFQDTKRMAIGLIGFAIVAVVYWSMSSIDEANREEKISNLEKVVEIEQGIEDRIAQREEKKKDNEVKRAALARKASGIMRQNAGNIPADWRQLTDEQKRQLALATREERELMFPQFAPRTCREWHKRLDKLAAKMR